MRDYKEQIDQLADLMEEFKLAEASLNVAGFQIAFRRHGKSAPVTTTTVEAAQESDYEEFYESSTASIPEAAKGVPVTSPMAGIYYSSANPASPPFVKAGDVVTAGQIIGLIEAMKVFNEIPSPYSGTVLEVLVESGGLVQPGDVIIRIG